MECKRRTLNLFRFPCCNASAIRFDTSIKSRGCMAMSHKIDSSQNNFKEFAYFQKREDIVSDSFISDNEEELQYTQLIEENDQLRKNIPTNKHISDTLPLSKIIHSIPFNLLLYKYLKTYYSPSIQLTQEESDESEGNYSVLDLFNSRKKSLYLRKQKKSLEGKLGLEKILKSSK